METQTLKLLILEDNEEDVVLIQRVLQRSGMDFDITIANDQQSFLSAIQNNEFDIILSDNYLPQFDATAAIQLMRENNINTPLILVTGTVTEGFAISMIKMGACDYILKDRLQRLPNAISNAVERHILKTKQKKELDDLIKNEANLRAILDNTDTGYALLDTSFHTVSFNRPLYRFSVEQLAKPLETGKDVTSFFKPEHQPIANKMLQDALKGISSRHEITYPQSDGSNKSVEVSCQPVKDNDQKVINIIMSYKVKSI